MYARPQQTRKDDGDADGKCGQDGATLRLFDGNILHSASQAPEWRFQVCAVPDIHYAVGLPQV
jgi:hypothetical protein